MHTRPSFLCPRASWRLFSVLESLAKVQAGPCRKLTLGRMIGGHAYMKRSSQKAAIMFLPVEMQNYH